MHAWIEQFLASWTWLVGADAPRTSQFWIQTGIVAFSFALFGRLAVIQFCDSRRSTVSVFLGLALTAIVSVAAIAGAEITLGPQMDGGIQLLVRITAGVLGTILSAVYFLKFFFDLPGKKTILACIIVGVATAALLILGHYAQSAFAAGAAATQGR